MTDKPKFAMYWAAACGGCEIAVLNTHEKILDVDTNFEVVFWPIAMDAKYKDVEAMEDGSILLTLFNGGIRSDENEHIARLLRRKSKILVAFGSCANEGCIPGLANLSDSREIVGTAFSTLTTDNPHRIYPRTSVDVPEGELRLPAILPVLKTLEQVVDVDYHMPGCPPESHQIAAVINGDENVGPDFLHLCKFTDHFIQNEDGKIIIPQVLDLPIKNFRQNRIEVIQRPVELMVAERHIIRMPGTR